MTRGWFEPVPDRERPALDRLRAFGAAGVPAAEAASRLFGPFSRIWSTRPIPPMHPTRRDLDQMQDSTPHERGCTVAEPCTECRPITEHPMFQGGWTQAQADRAARAGGRLRTVCCGGPADDPHRPDCPTLLGQMRYAKGGDLKLEDDGGALRLLPVELLRDLVADARQQLDNVRGQATLFRRRPELVEQAETGWRRENPGLSRLLDIADQNNA